MKNEKQFKTIIGVDLADRKHQICVTDKDGVILEEKKIENTRDALSELADAYPNSLLAMEVGTHSPWISRLLTSLGMTVVVANPRKLKYITENTRKSDVRDARALAKLVRLDPEVLCPIKHRSEQAQQSLLIIKLRDTLTKVRVIKITSLRGLFKSLSIRFPQCSTASFAHKAATFIGENHPEYIDLLSPFLDSIQSDTDLIKEYEAMIHNAIEQDYPEAKLLQTIPCVGELTALTFLLTIDDVNRFDDPREVGAFLGLVPRRDQSGDVDKELSITKAGDKLVRRLLVQCAQYQLGVHAPDSALRDWATRYLNNSGSKRAKKKAIVAVARKLAVTMVSMLKTQKQYNPYPNGKPKLTIEKEDKKAA